jgi:DNA mismatch repair protein MutL
MQKIAAGLAGSCAIRPLDAGAACRGGIPDNRHTVPSIQLLPSDLINQIAAGEVVERPASAVKELLENALDADAATIDVLLENGGRKRIEVRDDGCGMSPQDAVLAIERHATSKIRGFDDLTSVATLGFRGEALPSIASVSRFLLTTCADDTGEGTSIECDPMTGERTVRPAARDRGTTVSVRELFENVPARRKFLRSADAEFRSIVTVVSSYALANPTRAFRLEHNGRVVLDLPRVTNDVERVLQVIGGDAAEHLQAIDGSIGDVTVSGWVTRHLRFGSRRNQYFFVNGRLVRDRVLTHAAGRACEAFDFEGHPAVVLFVSMPPERVDVNVHPSKTEVRFRDSSQVHVAVEQSVRRALGVAEDGGTLIRETASSPSIPPALFPPQRYDETPRWPAAHTPLFQRESIVQPPVSLPEASALMTSLASVAAVEPPAEDLGELRGRIIGQYRLSYIAMDIPGGLRLVDQHAAHERVLYDRYRERVEARQAAAQQLLTPILYETGAAESAVLDSHLEELQAIGFGIERFSRNSFAISAVPMELLRSDVETFLRKLLDASMDEKSSHVARVRDRVAASLACQAAIKVHRSLTGAEMASLVADLLASSNPYACPHGRPVIVDIRHLDIERHFHRK